MRWFSCLSFAASVLLTGSSLLAQKKTWEYQSGKWPEVTPASPRPVSDPVLDQAETQYLAHGDTSAAQGLLFDWESHHKDSPIRDRAVFLIAQSYFQEDDRILAFYYFDEVMDEYPESRLFYPALQKQYKIADSFLSGYKRRFLGLAILPADDEAVEMMYRIQTRSPGSALAEKALLRTADYYFNDGQFDLAGDAYAAFVRSYPRSPQVARARLRQAFSSLAQFRGLKFDATNIIDARAQLLDVQRSYPKLAEEANVQAVIEQIDSAFAGKLLDTGDYYERVGQEKSAAYYYKFLVNTYGSSPEAGKARQRLASLPASAKTPPNPPPAGGFAPSTQPTSGGGLR